MDEIQSEEATTGVGAGAGPECGSARDPGRAGTKKTKGVLKASTKTMKMKA
jgi:hypothetical protein